MKLRGARRIAAGVASAIAIALLLAACNRVVLYALPDAEIDAPPPDAPEQITPRTEFTSGAARVTSTTYTLDLQFGHAMDQTVTESATYRIELMPPIKP